MKSFYLFYSIAYLINNISGDRMLKSMWLNTIQKQTYKPLQEDLDTDVLIIGGGITGISCAYELAQLYHNIVLVTMNEFYSGTTGFTTAKITYQQGFIYHDLLQNYEEKQVENFYEFNKQGLDRIKEIVTNEKINCDFEEVDGYLYSLYNEETKIKQEYEAYQKLNIPGELTTIFDNIALKVEKQAIFHPLKYLEGILNKISDRVKIYENTKIIDIDGNIATTEDDFTIHADKIIIATGYPLYPNYNLFFTKLIPSLSYVVVGKNEKEIKKANYINSSDPIVALRFYDNLAIVSGYSHESKEMRQENEEFKKLTDVAKDKFAIKDFEFAWSTRDYDSVDLLPFVGKVRSNVYIATGFSGWGMTKSVASAILIKDLIVGNESKFTNLFNPLRNAMSRKFFKYNMGMLNTIIKSKQGFEQLDDLAKSEGKIIKFNNRRYGIFKDDSGNIIMVKATCTHLGCGLTFNKIDRTYDCPCHGSKFNYDGRVLSGPAKRDLKVIRIKP